MEGKQFLVIQLRPEDETADSEFEAILRYGKLGRSEVKRIRMEKESIADINPFEFVAIIVGGSPFDISTPDNEKNEVQKRVEKEFRELFDKIVTKDHPFLGACSGNGLLGSYCGATISKEFTEPVGGTDVTLTKEGEKDPLTKGLPKTFRALVGHKEGCGDAPKGATLLATSDVCAQMFRVGENVYATQFHPEADAKEFETRINVYKHNGYFDPEEAEELIERVYKEETPHAQEILRRFVERFKDSQ